METRKCSLGGFNDLLLVGGIIEPLTLIDGGEILEDLVEVHFKGAVFEKQLVLNGSAAKGLVTFEDCEFRKGIAFKNITFQKGANFKNCNGEKIEFTNCSFDDLVFEQGTIDRVHFNGSVKFFENGNNQISFKDAHCTELLFKAKEINCSTSLVSSIFDRVTFQNTEMRGSINISEATKIESFEAQSSSFFNRIDFNECYFGVHVWIHKCSLEEQVVFRKEFKCNTLTFANVIGKQSVSVEFCSNLSSLDISDSNLNFTCSISTDHIPTESFRCEINGVINGNLVFTEVPIWAISIGAINFGNIIFDNITSKLITMKNFHNRNRLSMSNFKQDEGFSVLVIYDSNINQTEFSNIDFNNFNEVIIAKSEISNMILSHSRFPKNIQVETTYSKLGYNIPEFEKTNIDFYKKEAYRQLKIVMEKHGNRKEALQYQSLEMHYVKRGLRFGWDKILLELNHISNNYGASWIRGIVFTLAVSFTFFCLYNEANDSQFFYWKADPSWHDMKNGFQSGLDGFTLYWTTFPFFKFDNTQSDEWKLNLIIFLSRIFIGYGIYQTIAAFRKFGR